LKEIYHSALKADLKINQELEYYEADGSIALQHNIEDGPHHVFAQADVIYAEPAWRDGYDKFMHRAGATGDFKAYLAAISNAILELDVPAYIVMGSHMKKQLAPDLTIPIKLHGYRCLLGIWKADAIEARTNYDAVNRMAEEYSCILDFCCGYGNTAFAAKSHGKRFVCSDVNGKCIYYIAKELMGYEANHLY
jgi:hypothetical protein